ncbi:MAG: 4'-phosphopantetheinyl transferase family protein [Bacillota bacterium]
MMKLHVIHDYKSIHPGLKGSELTDAMIRGCLGREDALIERTERGKPYVSLPGEGPPEAPFISVSHSEGTFALLVSDREAGLDIQYARKVKTEKIAARYFTAEEAEYAAADETAGRFFELWTRKEAYGKYLGTGLEQIMKTEQVLSREDVRFTDLILEDGCFCAVCTGAEEGDQSDEIQISYGE